MANIKNLDMAQTISSNPNIKISKGFMGIGAKAVYTPTNSTLRALINYYSPEDGEWFAKLINNAPEDVVRLAENADRPKKLNISNYRLEACLSDDQQFAAIQILRYSDFRHVPIGEVKYLEGKAAQALTSLL